MGCRVPQGDQGEPLSLVVREEQQTDLSLPLLSSSFARRPSSLSPSALPTPPTLSDTPTALSIPSPAFCGPTELVSMACRLTPSSVVSILTVTSSPISVSDVSLRRVTVEKIEKRLILRLQKRQPTLVRFGSLSALSPKTRNLVVLALLLPSSRCCPWPPRRSRILARPLSQSQPTPRGSTHRKTTLGPSLLYPFLSIPPLICRASRWIVHLPSFGESDSELGLPTGSERSNRDGSGRRAPCFPTFRSSVPPQQQPISAYQHGWSNERSRGSADALRQGSHRQEDGAQGVAADDAARRPQPAPRASRMGAQSSRGLPSHHSRPLLCWHVWLPLGLR